MHEQISRPAGRLDDGPRESDQLYLPRSVSTASGSPSGAANYCYACGGGIDPRAFVCPRCGVRQRRDGDGLDPGVVAAVSVVTSPVIGMLLVRRWGLAVAYFAAAVVSVVLTFVVVGIFTGLALWLGGSYHAYSIAKEQRDQC